MKLGKILVSMIILVVSFPIFLWLESGLSIKSGMDLIRPIIFSLCAFFAYLDFYRRFLLIISLFMLVIMVVLYLFWKIDLSNWFGALGFGMLIIYTAAYIPNLLKKGFIEKL